MTVLKVGIIGCGGIARGKHLPSLAQVKEVEMVAFCDIVLERAEEAQEQYGTADSQVFSDYKEMLAAMDLDVVHVCKYSVYQHEIHLSPSLLTFLYNL